jgi:hypothetical protein
MVFTKNNRLMYNKIKDLPDDSDTGFTLQVHLD